MSKHLNFEYDLPHQTEAVNSVLNCFEETIKNYEREVYSNPIIINNREQININIEKIRQEKNLFSIPKKYKTKLKNGESEPLILDIHMETGTGKTYTYTKTIFELNKEKGINKFIIVVPTLSIKAGTVNFLTSSSSRRHFRDVYDKNINCLIVQSKEGKKGNKNYFPQEIKEFINKDLHDKNDINVLVINQGMINSKTVQEQKYDIEIFGKFSDCISGIAGTNPVIIIDEPHKFKENNKTWANILKFEPQLIIRYGATFDDNFYDLIHSLDSVKAFNDDLIKGIVVEIEESESGKNEKITLKSTTSKEAIFSYVNDLGKETSFSVGKGEQLHSSIIGLSIDELNTKRVLLSNGYEMKIKASINPFSYSESIQEKLMKDSITKHFELEEKYMKDISPRIKPMTLFFIDNISSYRNENKNEEHLRIYFEQVLESFLKEKIKMLEKEGYKGEYKEYLEKSLADISKCHGGYFAKDNNDSDENVEKEINEILHDKEALLDIDNPRRFIFSKWTLREGWDNPNIFVICKLRGSGSDTNKLQEVGRGLRIPVNEYMYRVTDREHFLHYFVDFTEKDFVGKLVGEINNSKLVREDLTILSDEFIVKIAKLENKTTDDIFDELRELKIIDRKSNFIKDGYLKLKEKYPELFDEVKSNKIIDQRKGKTPNYIHIRKEKYETFKKLWEELNSKVIIKYDFKNNNELQNILNEMIMGVEFFENGITTSIHTLKKGEDGKDVTFESQDSLYTQEVSVNTLTYKEFLLELEKLINIPLNMLHQMFIYLSENKKTEVNTNISKRMDINRYLNHSTIKKIKANYIKYMIENSYTKMKVNYEKVDTEVHPTKLTDNIGNPLSRISASDFGTTSSEKKAPNNYLYDEIFFDSEIERENIENSVRDITLFAKIPKNSIRIPVIGGGTYSPDFAYILRREDGKEDLNLIIESKGKEMLNPEETMKIVCAEKLFKSYLGKDIKIKFDTQLRSDRIRDIIQKALRGE
ncbi:MAG: type III restriction-modification system endonuclease [Fusobacteriaceae bacterium]